MERPEPEPSAGHPAAAASEPSQAAPAQATGAADAPEAPKAAPEKPAAAQASASQPEAQLDAEMADAGEQPEPQGAAADAGPALMEAEPEAGSVQEEPAHVPVQPPAQAVANGGVELAPSRSGGLASLLGSKAARGGRQAGGNGCLGDLLWAGAPVGGLAALAMAQPPQAKPAGEEGGGAALPGPETPSAAEAEGGGSESNGSPQSQPKQGAPAKKEKQVGKATRRADAPPKRVQPKRKPASEPAGPRKRARGTRAAASAPARRARGKAGGKARGRPREETPNSEPELEASDGSDGERGLPGEAEAADELFGCAGCGWRPRGCAECRAEGPAFTRPQGARWRPEEARFQRGIPEAPTFHPTEEEFADPLAYINKIRPEGEKAGIACIVPPPGWAPPFALSKGTNGLAADSFRFSIRRQPTWQLCRRAANPKRAQPDAAASSGRYGAEKHEGEEGGEGERGGGGAGGGAGGDAESGGEFGFVTLDRPQTLTSFRAYADWAKRLHFGLRSPREGGGKRRRTAGGRQAGEGPSVEEVEGEFWRIVETPDEAVESLYGQDLDSGHHGSGFPLPPFRRRLLEAHLAAAGADGAAQLQQLSEEEAAYSQHCWNINNLPRCKGSVLRYVVGEELITGVMVPWLYVGSCMSAFCWHIEDHALYSINYLHLGAEKVWYGVPAHASAALEEAVRDALPHLFETAPDLLYQLVTMVSPQQLRARGVPVHRLVHKAGSFVITFPNAYHAGFNAGFNCAEAVNFGPPDWLPWGCAILDKYRRDRKAATLSNDALLVALVQGAEEVAQQVAQEQAQQQAQAESCRVRLALEPRPDGSVAASLRLADDAGEERAASGRGASTSGRTVPAVPGQREDTSFLDPIRVRDAPEAAVRLAAAELALRTAEERRRRAAGLPDGGAGLACRRMTGKPGAVDSAGVHTDTEDTDCGACKCDLWLSAVVSPKAPGAAFCPEHAAQLGLPPADWLLLYRFTPEELDAMLATAEAAIPGTREAIKAAQHRARNPPCVPITRLGPLEDQLPAAMAAEEPEPESAADSPKPEPVEVKPKAEPAEGEEPPKAEPPVKAEPAAQEAAAPQPASEPEDAAAAGPEPSGGSASGCSTPPREAPPSRGGRRRVVRSARVAAAAAVLAAAGGDPDDEEYSPTPVRRPRGRGRGGRGGGRGRGRKQPTAARPPPVDVTPAQEAQQEVGTPGSGGANSNSVLMDILRASVQAQPQGHVTAGSVPLSQASGEAAEAAAPAST